MTDSLADLLKRQQQSSTPKAPETPPHDEAAEVAAIAKEQAAKAAVIAGRLLGKASKQGAQKSVELSQQARQRLAEVTPEQWIKIRQNATKAGLVVIALTGLLIIIWGGTKAWHAWHGHQTKAGTAEPAPTVQVQAQMPDGTTKTITIPATAVSTARPAEAASASTPTPTVTPSPALPVPPTPVAPTPPVSTRVEVPATAETEPTTQAVPTPRAVQRQSQGVNSGRQSTRQRMTQSTQGVNARYHHTAPVFNQQKYRPDPLLAPKHHENWFTQMAGQPNPVAKQRPQPSSSADPQEQQNMKALDQFFQKLNKEKPATQQGNTNGSQPAHQ